MNTSRSTTELIYNAFSSVARLSQAREIASHECPECEQLGGNLIRYAFTEVPDKIVEFHHADLPLLSPQGLHYYLPTWLLYSLGHPDSGALESTVFHLTPSEARMLDDPEYWGHRFDAFTTLQREAIRAFFAEVRENGWWEAFDGEFERAEVLWSSRT